MKLRLLFVDDEPEVLEGLRVRLRQRRQQWKMSFATSGKEALEILEREPFDIMVSDLRMPEMDGATLMQLVRDRHPGIARVMLSGHGDERLLLRALCFSHEFLPKPSPPGVLESTLERIAGLRDMVSDVAVREAVGRISWLPAQPLLYQQLLSALADEGTPPEAVASIILGDPALCAQLLHIVNSAYFGLSRKIVKVDEAVVYLGLGTVKQLVLVAELFRDADAHASVINRSIKDLQDHCLLTASIASGILSGYPRRDLAFVAALLHDIGKLVIASQLPERASRILQRVQDEDEAMNTSERALYGTTHAEIGGYLLGLWQLPFPVVEAVANHHQPSKVDPKEFDVLVAVHVADCLAQEANGAARPAELDLPLLERLGVDHEINEWRTLAASHAKR
jgi:HD-like signal output (HDOD) protein/CheY-like chemotaxis protein